jgi:hypothetical protein
MDFRIRAMILSEVPEDAAQGNEPPRKGRRKLHHIEQGDLGVEEGPRNDCKGPIRLLSEVSPRR